MTILDRAAAFLGYERRRGGIRSDAYLSEYFGLRGTGAGAVNPDAVLSASAVATACVSRRAQGLASVPLQIHKNIGPSDARRDESHPLWHLLNVSPNSYQSAFEFREFLTRSHDLFGNAYALIERDAAGQVVALHPIPPANVSVERIEPVADPVAPIRLRYRVSGLPGGTKVYLADEILHVRGPSRDGIVGLSPIAIARGAMGFMIEQSETAQNLIQNGLRPSGALTTSAKLDKSQVDSLKEQASTLYAGAGNSGRVMVLTGDLKFEPFAWTPEDSEFLASRKLSAEDVARIFDCPPTTVGLVDRSTYSNTEQESIALVRQCLTPLAARFESAMARCLLTSYGQRKFFLRHDFGELLRGDMQARFESYRVAREAGIYSANDCRRLENEAPIGPAGDVYNQPANWSRLGAEPSQPRTRSTRARKK